MFGDFEGTVAYEDSEPAGFSFGEEAGKETQTIPGAVCQRGNNHYADKTRRYRKLRGGGDVSFFPLSFLFSTNDLALD